jgi:hypothetical protein
MNDATGKEIKVFKGFIQAGGTFIKQNRLEILNSARAGKTFGKEMAWQVMKAKGTKFGKEMVDNTKEA